LALLISFGFVDRIAADFDIVSQIYVCLLLLNEVASRQVTPTKTACELFLKNL